MYKNIVFIITNYYYYILKNSLQILNIFNKTDLEYIISYIKLDNNTEIEEYSKNIKQILLNSINNLTKEKLLCKIDFFLHSQIFPNIDKSLYINPLTIINKNKITFELLSMFFRTILYDSVLEYYLHKKRDVIYYQKYDNLKLNSEEDFINVYKIINYLEEDINIFYRKVYLPFYVNIINKLDNHADYIFPMIIDNNILVSGVINDKICDSAGSNTDLIQYKLEEMYSEPFIKNLYTKSEIQQLEDILNNEKLNSLIRQKKIKLSKNFQEMLKNIVEKKDYKNLQDYVKKIFIVQDNEEKIDVDKIANIVSSQDNKKFLEYFIDKIIYNEHLNNNNSKEIISMIDTIFDKILSHDYNHNSLNLENEDIKFILMLETLNTLKSNSLQMPSTSNITLNVYKDINKATVNDNEIQIDY